MDTLNDNAKSYQWKRFILQFTVKKSIPPEYFLVAVRGYIYFIKGG